MLTVQKILTKEVTFTFFKNFFNVKEPKQSPQSFFFQLDYRNLKCVIFFLLTLTHHFLSISVTLSLLPRAFIQVRDPQWSAGPSSDAPP